MKLFKCISISILFFQTCYCPTSVFIRNNTPEKLIIRIKSIGLGSGEDYRVKAVSINPWERKSILTMNRHLIPEGNYYFFTTVVPEKLKEAQPIKLVQHFRKPSIGVSKMRYGILDTSAKTVSQILKRGLQRLEWKTVDGSHIDVYCDDFSKFGKSFHDIEYTFSLRPFSGATVDDNKNVLRIAHLNTYMRPLFLFPFDGQLKRAGDIPSAIMGSFEKHKPDVVAFNEVFSTKAESILREKMKSEGYSYVTDVIGKKTPEPSSGGVILFSYWPIKSWEQMKYKACRAEDCAAAKGALFAAIDKNGMKYYIFATHLQADTGDVKKCKQAREKQFKELRAFIDRMIKKYGIKMDEPIIIVGDFNVKKDDKEEYESMIKILRAKDPGHIGYKFSHEGDKAILDYILSVGQSLDGSSVEILRKRFQVPWNRGGPKFNLRFNLSDHEILRARFSCKQKESK